MNKSEKMALDLVVKKIEGIAKDLNLDPCDVNTIAKVAAIRHGKPLRSPLESAELTLKELISIGSHGEISPNDIILNMQGVSDFLQSDKEYLEKAKKEINNLINGGDDA